MNDAARVFCEEQLVNLNVEMIELVKDFGTCEDAKRALRISKCIDIVQYAIQFYTDKLKGNK